MSSRSDYYSYRSIPAAQPVTITLSPATTLSARTTPSPCPTASSALGDISHSLLLSPYRPPAPSKHPLASGRCPHQGRRPRGLSIYIPPAPPSKYLLVASPSGRVRGSQRLCGPIDVSPRRKTEKWARDDLFVELGEYGRDGLANPGRGDRRAEELKGMFGLLVSVGMVITLLGVLLLLRGQSHGARNPFKLMTED